MFAKISIEYIELTNHFYTFLPFVSVSVDIFLLNNLLVKEEEEKEKKKKRKERLVQRNYDLF